MNKCPFCSPNTARIVFEEADVFAYKDGFPVSSGHLLVIPKRHISSLLEASSEELNTIMAAIIKAQNFLKKEVSPDGFNIGINEGYAAGQTVSHLHIHIIPRYKNDCADPRGGVRWVIPDKADYWS